MNWEWHLAFSKHTESWRLSRRLIDRSLRPASIVTYRPLLQTKTQVLLTQLLTNPDKLDVHLYQFVLAFFWHSLFF